MEDLWRRRLAVQRRVLGDNAAALADLLQSQGREGDATDIATELLDKYSKEIAQKPAKDAKPK